MVDSTNPDLRPFEEHGGKIIQYHGWADPALTPSRAPKNYEQIQSFYRLFMVPGMSHCGTGPGPNAFGNYAKPPVIDPEHDVLTALNRWVEHGVAPRKLIATHYADNDPAMGVQFQRPLCPYPQVAHYNGHGNPSDAAHFTCR